MGQILLFSGGNGLDLGFFKSILVKQLGFRLPSLYDFFEGVFLGCIPKFLSVALESHPSILPDKWKVPPLSALSLPPLSSRLPV